MRKKQFCLRESGQQETGRAEPYRRVIWRLTATLRAGFFEPHSS